MFTSYLQLGFDHILDIQGYDHILYILILCSLFTIKEYKNVLILVTAFTVGHSLTLALAALNILNFPSYIIEILIPTTIILTALHNIWISYNDKKLENINLNYILAALFGLIHGLGFSYLFRALLDKEESILAPLLPFNLGVELGQVIIVTIALILNHLVTTYLKVSNKYWNYAISVTGIVISIYLITDRI